MQLSKVLAEEPVYFEELEEDRWSLYFGPVFLCVLDLREGEPRMTYERPTMVTAQPPQEPA